MSSSLVQFGMGIDLQRMLRKCEGGQWEVGDIKAPRILIADGAGFKGHIDMDVD